MTQRGTKEWSPGRVEVQGDSRTRGHRVGGQGDVGSAIRQGRAGRAGQGRAGQGRAGQDDRGTGIRRTTLEL